MTNLTRVTGKIFGETASTTNIPKEIGQFGSAKAGTYNATGDVATIQNLSAWSNGWIDAVTPTQQFPSLPEMTGVHKVLSYQTAYTLQKGVPEWDAGTTYYTGDFAKGVGVGKLYVSKIDNNLNNALTDTDSWELFTDGLANTSLSNLTDAGNIYGGGLAFPSTTSEDLTFGASGTTYTAPANGWVSIMCVSTSTNNWLSIGYIGWGVLSSIPTSNNNVACMVPVTKGQTFGIYYANVTTNSSSYFKFYYAIGSESEYTPQGVFMWIAKNNDLIILAKDTREELENALKMMVYTSIEETETEYQLYNGEYLTPEEQAEKRQEEFLKDFFNVEGFGYYRKQPKGYQSAVESMNVLFNIASVTQGIQSGLIIFYEEPDFYNPDECTEEWLVEHQIIMPAMTLQEFMQLYVAFMTAWNAQEHISEVE